MLPGLSSEARIAPQTSVRVGQAFACSLLLHVIFAILCFYVVAHSARHREQSLARFLPVDIVPLAQHATSLQQAFKAPLPREALTRRAHEVPSSPHRPVALSLRQRQRIQDPLELRLKQLARLRQPDSTVPHLENGASDEVATPSVGSYRVNDFLRAQVERRWSLDLKHGRNAIIMIHVRVERDGTVTEADIVDKARYANDATWRATALSARNAVLLSSPLNLPAGYAGSSIDVVLAMNPKDAMR
jgi:hypothetical protein